MMFGSLEEAIKLGEAGKKRDQDGGVPVFEERGEPKAGVNREDVDYEDVIWVKIHNIGDNKNIIERPMREEDKQRWPEHWEAFKKNKEPPLNGIPIEDFPGVTPAERMKLKGMHVRTIEELVGLPDNQLERLGGRGRMIHKAAREFLAYKEGESISDLQDEIQELKKQIKELSSGNSTRSNSKRGAGNKSPKTKRSNKRGSGSSRKSVSDSEDGGEPPEE